ncbi:MAG: type I 3-dehydroquinate dehydratase [Candidatus Nitrosoabyssus spongiisocia]|nr:MAG: type I 3-dehydroquinate dehydratase [Nitrosopumilaceae archaeon AB1(1)]
MTSLNTCVSIAVKSKKKLYNDTITCLKKSKYVELRLDHLPPKDVQIILEELGPKLSRCICTLRPKREGGNFTQSEKKRVELLKIIIGFKPYLVDIEYNTLNNYTSLYTLAKKSNILVSWHDFKKTPSVSLLNKRLDSMQKMSKNIKIVTMCTKPIDASLIISLYGKVKADTKLVAFGMGSMGRISRLLCLYLGSPFTYVSLGKAVAPGQFSLAEIIPLLKRR